MLGGAISWSPATLAPSDTATCGPVLYTVTQGDVNSGFVHNEATVTGKDPDDNDVTDEAETNTGLDQNPAIALDKQVVSDGPYGLNDTIEYTITDRKSTRLQSSHVSSSHDVCCSLTNLLYICVTTRTSVT